MLGAILKREPGFELVGEAEDATSAVELALRRRPDVVLLDVDMPGGGGARAAVQIRESMPDVRIVAISADDSQGSQYDMMRAGAVGFITKGSSDDEILRVIRSLSALVKRYFGHVSPGEGREIARDAGAPAVPDFTLATAGGARQAAFTSSGGRRSPSRWDRLRSSPRAWGRARPQGLLVRRSRSRGRS